MSKLSDFAGGGGSVSLKPIGDFSERIHDAGDVSGPLTLSTSQGQHFRMRLTGDLSLTLDTPTPTGQVSSITLEIVQDDVGGHTVTWPSATKFIDGIAIQISQDPNVETVVTGYTTDGGNTWRLIDSAKNLMSAN